MSRAQEYWAWAPRALTCAVRNLHHRPVGDGFTAAGLALLADPWAGVCTVDPFCSVLFPTAVGGAEVDGNNDCGCGRIAPFVGTIAVPNPCRPTAVPEPCCPIAVPEPCFPIPTLNGGLTAVDVDCPNPEIPLVGCPTPGVPFVGITGVIARLPRAGAVGEVPRFALTSCGVITGASGVIAGVDGVVAGADGVAADAEGVMSCGVITGGSGVIAGADGVTAGVDGVTEGIDGVAAGAKG